MFTIAKRNVEGQDMLYLSIKFINGLWALLEIKVAPGSANITVSAGRPGSRQGCRGRLQWFVLEFGVSWC